MGKDQAAPPSAADKAIIKQTETLRGDIRDQILREFKSIPKSWQQSSEQEQKRLIQVAADVADQLVRRAVDIVAAKGLASLPIEVGKVTIDGEACKGSFECYADDEQLLRIRRLQGSRAMFVLASPEAFSGEQKKAEPDNVGELAMPKGADKAAAPGTDRGDAAQLAQVGRGKQPQAPAPA